MSTNPDTNPLEQLFTSTTQKPKLLSPLTLAFIGDVVFELMIRQKVLNDNGNISPNMLHKKTVEYVKAASQAIFLDKIYPMLNEEEIAIYKRGRNSNSIHPPKNCEVAVYRKATGFETLFGYLYLCSDFNRISELLKQL